MNTLINITENNGIKVVSARELHIFLEVDTQFSVWSKRMLDYGFTENQDYSLIKIGERNAHNKIDYALTIDTAKEISMLQRTDKGKQARQYFIECEKQLKQPDLPQNYISALEALLESKKQEEKLQKQLNAQQAKIDFIDRVIVSEDTVDIGQCAKILELNFGRNTLFKKLLELGILFKNRNEPKQVLVDRGYFKLKEQFIETKNHGTKAIIKVLVTQRGLGFLTTKLKANPNNNKPALLT